MLLGSNEVRIRRIHDITQPLDERTAVWPGDREVSMDWTMRRERGDSVNVASLCLSVHAGTHMDGPLHFEDDGGTAANVPLEHLIGRARVIDARGRDELDVDLLEGIDAGAEERLLFRCFEQFVPGRFPDPFPAVTPALARACADAGVKLIATESPSIDTLGSKTLESHRLLQAGDVVIIENVVLRDVPAGRYSLVALPLRLTDADSAPVRAVLLELQQG